MAPHKVEAVEAFRELLGGMLDQASITKQADTIEPPILKADIADLLQQVQGLECFATIQKMTQNAVIETAVREVFNESLATSRIDEPEFVQVWNLLDIVAILSDDGQCEPALLFWLVEELLDSQTIAGCRKIFDYLESRRERITAKHFKQKNLVILRTCNELLRRLSRAEDTAFCGRVFIFMFQSFPLGDKSSVNLRGEYHVENVTTFDEIPGKTEPPADQMEIDTDVKPTTEESKNNSKSVTFNGKGEKPVETPLDADTLYPIFWSLQQIFSQPKRLFDEKYFTEFKKGLEATMVMFRSVQNEQSDRNLPKPLEDGKKNAKRKRGEGDDDLASTFNPKYLTSRDLFELEISDLSFRRYILVQALIVMDFLISLSSKAKEKLTGLTTQNKSVMYQDQVLSEDDIKWAINTKKSIEQYLKDGFEGPFFHRMVETVLSRDKNWVRWKIENCPSIERPAVTPEEYLAAKAGARKAAAVKRLRPKPMGSLDLAFLSQTDGAGDMERLKDPARYEVPSLASFREKIALDELEIEMPESDESKEAAVYGKASKSWQALRIASKTKLAAFDKIEDPEKIDSIFQEETTEDKDAGDESAEVEDVAPPVDKRPIVISGPSGVGKGTLMGMLITKYPKLFGKKTSHTTRAPRVGEEDTVHYYFINSETYNMMRDGDQFLEFNNFNGTDYGTSRRVVEGIVAAGKIPVMEMDYHGIQQLKDQSYPSRFIFLNAPNMDELKLRLQRRGTETDENIAQRLKIAEEEIEEAKTEGFHDLVLTNDDLEKTFEAIEGFIFGKETEAGEKGEPKDADMEIDEDTAVDKKEGDGGDGTTAEGEDVPMGEATDGEAKAET